MGKSNHCRHLDRYLPLDLNGSSPTECKKEQLPPPLVLSLPTTDLANFSYTADFWRQHVDYPRFIPKGGRSRYCSWMMKQRGLVWDSECELFNTFIHEKNFTIENVCNRTPRPCRYRHIQLCHISPRPFSVSDCFAIPGSQPPNCQYWVKFQHRNISITCHNGLPSYLDA
ncbi:ribonuclease-like [Phascolarctos cinereus]